MGVVVLEPHMGDAAREDRRRLGCDESLNIAQTAAYWQENRAYRLFWESRWLKGRRADPSETLLLAGRGETTIENRCSCTVSARAADAHHQRRRTCGRQGSRRAM